MPCEGRVYVRRPRVGEDDEERCGGLPLLAGELSAAELRQLFEKPAVARYLKEQGRSAEEVFRTPRQHAFAGGVVCT